MVWAGVRKRVEQEKQEDHSQTDSGADDTFAKLPHTALLRRLEEFFDFREHILDDMPEVAVFLDLSDTVGNSTSDFFSGTGGGCSDGVGPLNGGPDNMQLPSTGSAVLALISIFSGTVRTEHDAPFPPTV
jgi:hypothetical protein